jgi:hypothetical protein
LADRPRTLRRAAAALILSIVVLVLAVFAAAGAPPVPVGPGAHKLIVNPKDSATIEALTRQGGRQLIDYGSFALWAVPVTAAQALSAPAQTAVVERDDLNRVSLRGGLAIDTSAALTQAAPRLNGLTARTAGAQFWVVQFVGPIKPEWLELLTGAGLRIVGYLPANAYVVWGDTAALGRLDSLVVASAVIQWTGPYQSAYRLAPDLAARALSAPSGAPTQWVDVTVQLYAGADIVAELARLRSFGGQVYRGPSTLLDFTNISLQLPADQLNAAAADPVVFNVESYVPPQRLDEVQDQIVAGAVTTFGGNIVPSGPGYLSWLATLGFPITPASYPIVDVVDDGIDTGNVSNILHPDFHYLGVLGNSSRVSYINNCTSNSSGNGVDGHGNLNAGIVGAYNNRTGSPHQDANGYRIGLGVSPYGRIGGTKIFADGGSYSILKCANSDQGVVAASYNAGADLTSNSWGSDVGSAYDSSSQAYDALTRDASPPTPGNQEMLHVFAAGNAGSGANTIDSPGTAKNVLTVGATENVRDNGVVDGCGISAANNADDMASFSSRGPTDDGRIKPDIVAPGIHVQGPASQDPAYNGSGVCDTYYPAGQTLYTWSTGTSHSTPAVAGAASLAYEYYGRILAPGQTPSPAMLKALLLNSTRYLTGSGANDTLPSSNQGWGDVNLGTLFDGAPRQLVDESVLFTATGQGFIAAGYIADPTRPFRVTLAWTDRPGVPPALPALVNDLDLQVTVGGNTYRGNVFSGRYSVSGGVADHLNNVESVFLPSGITGPYEVRVIAANIAGDGVPGNATTVDQDFALVVYDGVLPQLDRGGVRWTDSAPGGNGNGVIEPGETIALSIDLTNVGVGTASGINATLAASGAFLQVAASAYPDIGPGAAAPNNVPYIFRVGATTPCGLDLVFTQTVTYSGGLQFAHTFRAPVSGFAYHGPPLSIPDNDPAGVSAVIDLTAAGVITDVDVHVDVSHTYDADLSFYLIASGTTVTLTSGNGGSGAGYLGTIFDDMAPTQIGAGSAPFTGHFRPDSPLAALKGKPIAGPWTLKVVDQFTLDVGRIVDFGLEFPGLLGTCTRPAFIQWLPIIVRNWAAP